MVSPRLRRNGPGQHPRRAAPAEIGFESRRQGGAGGESGKGCSGKARGLAQLISFGGRERTRPDPAECWSVRPWADGILLDDAGGQSGEPMPAGIVLRARPAQRRKFSRHEAEGLDHLPAFGPPQPGAPCDKRMRHRHCQGAARKRKAIRHQTCAEFGQQLVRTRRLGGRIDKPGKRRRKLHGPNHGLTALPCHGLFPKELAL